MRTVEFPSSPDAEEGDREFPLGCAMADWKENADTILEAIDEQLKEYGLEVVNFETYGGYYAWKIEKRN